MGGCRVVCVKHLSLGAIQNGVILLCGEEGLCGAGKRPPPPTQTPPTPPCRPVLLRLTGPLPCPNPTPPTHPCTDPAGLFFYDIFWVFGTPVMVSVAKNLDAPIKLLFPRWGEAAGACTGRGRGGVGWGWDFCCCCC